MVKKKKILFHSDFALSKTGFGRNTKAILSYLYNTGKYDIVSIAGGLTKNHPELKLDSEVPLPSEDDVVRFYENTPGIKEMGTLKKMRSEIIVYLEKVFHNTYVIRPMS